MGGLLTVVGVRFELLDTRVVGVGVGGSRTLRGALPCRVASGTRVVDLLTATAGDGACVSVLAYLPLQRGSCLLFGGEELLLCLT